MINEITILKGQSLVLTCSLHAIPLPTIIWTKNDQILFDSERFYSYLFRSMIDFFFLYRISMSDHNFKLHIENTLLTDRGRYQCQAENLVGRSQQIFDVQIYSKHSIEINFQKYEKIIVFLVPPEIQQSNINLNPYVILGKSLILSCHGFGVPEINYQWLKDKKNVLESHSYARLNNISL
jgi:hypothetical protein